VERFTDKMRPLNERVQENKFWWGEIEEDAFKKVKDCYRGNQILILHDPEKQTFVHTDASDYAISGEISQLDNNGKRRPVLFFSRKLTPAEMNYSTPDKEMLAIVQVMKKYQHYLRGTKHPVIVRTDHRNLRTFMTTKELNARQARWAEELSAYNFVIEHVKGRENVVADALSRRPDYEEEKIVERTKQFLKETDKGLEINKDIHLGMISFESEDSEINKEICEEMEKDERRLKCEKKDGYYLFKGMIMVPKDWEKRVIERYHDDIREGHPGEARTAEKIQRTYYFPGMTRKIRKYIRECEACQKNKITYQKPKGQMQLGNTDTTPIRPWQHITADFVDMPATKGIGNTSTFDQILVVVDRFSKQTILIPTRKKATTEEIFHLLWERIFAIFGIPETMTSDRDKIFRTEKWQQLMKGMGAKQVLSTAHHQQTDGQTERKIQEIQSYLRNYLDYDQRNWLELTPIAQYALNDAQSATTGETPNFVTFGTKRREGWDTFTEEGIAHQERMKMIHQSITKDLEWNRLQQKEYYDRRRVEAPSLEEGDRVYLRRRTSGEKKFNIKTLRTSTKLDHLKLGPFTIKKKLDFDNYELKLPPRMKIHPIFHISLLDKTGNAETTDNIDALDEEFEVEKIIDKRVRNGRTEYRVRWTGYGSDADTWEPTTHLHCPEKVQEFESVN
jgi:RNase H-like domain found in reverse transcriptase/Integrase zinc binding domain/Chromo (CHRromatin Organisation MOdifier) domain/Integrase core domain